MLKDILADQTRTLLQRQTHSQEVFQRELRDGQETLRKDLQNGQETLLRDQELRAHQEDLRNELKADQGKLRDDLTREVQHLNRSCTTQFQDLQQSLQVAERGVRDLTLAQGSIESRLQVLETRGASETGTVATTSVSGGPGGRRPALVLGGWDPDTAAADMLRHAKRLLQELRLDLDVDDIFVPGVRRGFAILPYGARTGEAPEAMSSRIQGAITKVKASNYVAPGRQRPIWLVPSRSPAERKRSALAGKTKRLILQLSTDAGSPAPALEVERGSGTVWLQGTRVASASSSPPQHAEPVTSGGWIDLQSIAAKLHLSRARVTKEWEPLGAALT
jgi:hypothetical protein